VYLNITNISQDYVNVSRLYNVSNVSGDYYNVTIYTDNYTDGTWVIQVYANDSDGNANNTQNITVRFDQTIPNEVNITSSHVTRGNYSGTQTFNFSILDVTAGGGSLWINISNSTTVEVVRSTINASNPSSIYWNVSVDTSDFVDGLYNVSVTANDSAGNTNTTLVILQDIRIDNTNPTGTVSCSPSTVTAGGGVTCTCSPSDGGSGINTSATINPATSTSNTGTFTQTCTFKDLAGNTGTASSSYTVELSGGSGGGGGGGGSSSSSFSYRKTIPVIADDLKNLGTLTQPVGEKERVKVKIASAKVGEDEVHYIGVRKLTLTSAVVEIASDPVRIELDIGEDAKVDVNDDGFYDVYVKLESITNGKADLLIRYLNEEIPEEKEEESVDTTGEIVPEEVEEESSLMWLWVLIVVIVVIVIGWVVAKKGKR
ncbi:hypothetical protein CMI42_01255, partial [Candidatus Pacearchaeota archaeon]|nr:hypothetical protein [Candidatus Pacearchaeota archaeon]